VPSPIGTNRNKYFHKIIGPYSEELIKHRTVIKPFVPQVYYLRQSDVFYRFERPSARPRAVIKIAISQAAMVRIAIGQAAFEATARTLPLGGVGFENATNGLGQKLIWLDRGVVNRLRAMRGPGESYSDVILRITGRDDRKEPRAPSRKGKLS
jgi:hypothetical protein